MLKVSSHKNGGYDIQDEPFRLASEKVAVQLKDKPEFVPDFKNQEKKKFCLNKIQGAVLTDTSLSDDIAVTREIFICDQSRYTAVRFRVKNVGKECVNLQSVKPLIVNNQRNLLVNDKGADKWRVFRLPIQKSDIPGCFRPSVHDKDYADAVFSSLGAVAGQGIECTDTDLNIREVTSGPLAIIADDSDNSAARLLICILGQSNHLGDMSFKFSDSGKEMHSLEINYEFDSLLLEENDSIDTHWLLFYTGDNEPDMLAEYAELLADEYDLPVPKSPMVLYCDWYFYTVNVTQKYMEEEIEAIRQRQIPFDAFIIDNGWMDEFGTYNANNKFPDGMEYIAGKMKDAGMMPGIWTCPAIIDRKSVYLDKYPDLIAYDSAGSPLEFISADSQSYLIDPSSSCAASYYKEVYGKLKGWGYRYYKLDYLRSIMEHKDIQFQNPKVNRAMAYRLMLSHVRNALGNDCYICGCGGITDAANLGLIDAYRTSKDVRNQWAGPGGDRTSGALIQMKQNLFRNYTNRFWNCDPDSTLIRLRDKPFLENEKKRIGVYLSEGHYTDEEARTILTHQYLTGGNVCVSERIPELQKSRLEMLRHITPVSGPPARILDFDRPTCPTLFLSEITPCCQSLGKWWTLTVANWDENEVIRKIKLEDIPLNDDHQKYAVFEFYTQRFIGIKTAKDEIQVGVPSHGMRVLRIMPFDDTEPVLLGTDLHITGGGCEITACDMTISKIQGTISSRWAYPIELTFGLPAENNNVDIIKITVPEGESVFEWQRTRD